MAMLNNQMVYDLILNITHLSFVVPLLPISDPHQTENSSDWRFILPTGVLGSIGDVWGVSLHWWVPELFGFWDLRWACPGRFRTLPKSFDAVHRSKVCWTTWVDQRWLAGTHGYPSDWMLLSLDQGKQMVIRRGPRRTPKSEGVYEKTWVISHVPIEHHPTIRYMVYNGYYKVMSNIPKMGHLPTPEK